MSHCCCVLYNGKTQFPAKHKIFVQVLIDINKSKQQIWQSFEPSCRMDGPRKPSVFCFPFPPYSSMFAQMSMKKLSILLFFWSLETINHHFIDILFLFPDDCETCVLMEMLRWENGKSGREKEEVCMSTVHSRLCDLREARTRGQKTWNHEFEQ